MTTRIELPKHLSEYIKGKFGAGDDVVHFPANSGLYFLLYELLQRRPSDYPVDRGNTEIHLPSPRSSRGQAGKPVESFNYISKGGTIALKKAINTMMKVESHEFFDENKHVKGISYIDSAYMFLQKYGIESLTPEALLKDYQRWRVKSGRPLYHKKRKNNAAR